MSSRTGQGRALGIIIGIAAVVVGLAVFAALHIKLPKASAAKTGETVGPAVALIRLDPGSGRSALQEQAALYDPSPLFLPTAYNTSDPALPLTLRREPGAAFQAFPARYTFAEFEMKVTFPEPIQVPQSPMEAIKTGEVPNPFYTFGRLSYDYRPLPARGAFIEVLQAKTGKAVLSGPLPIPDGVRQLAGDWQPLELVAAVDAVGSVGEPTVTSGSGSEEVDNFFRELLVKQFRLGERLRPGFYTVRIGP